MNSEENLCEEWGALFDLDGVLVDSEGEYTRFWHLIDEKYPTGIEDFEYVIKGNTLGNILSTYFPDPVVQSSIVDMLKEQEQGMRYILFDGVLELLEDLVNHNCRTAIVTSSNSLKMSHLFEQHPRLLELVEVVITEENVKFSKPHPQGYNLAATSLGLKPHRCIVFEDSVAGVQAGRRAGGAVVGITTTNPAEMLANFADILIDSIDSVTVDMLVGLLKQYDVVEQEL